MSDDVTEALRNPPDYVWDVQRPAAENYYQLGRLLAESVELLVLIPEGKLVVVTKSGDYRIIETATGLDAVIKDRIDARQPNGKDIPKRDLGTMLKSDVFLDCFRPVGSERKSSR